jgi:restriction system protein
MRDLLLALTDHIGLTSGERERQIPNGTERLFDNRTWWASTYLVKAGLLERPHRGYVRITADGARVLQDQPARIDNAFLARFTTVPKKSEDAATPLARFDPTLSPDTRTPDEILEATWLDRRKALGQDLLARVKASSPAFFERLVIDLLVKMGYGGSIADAASVVGAPNDEGIDGLIREDKLGLDVVYVQAKKWEQAVGRPFVQALPAALKGSGLARA